MEFTILNIRTVHNLSILENTFAFLADSWGCQYWAGTYKIRYSPCHTVPSRRWKETTLASSLHPSVNYKRHGEKGIARHCGINGRDPATAGKDAVYAAKGLVFPFNRMTLSVNFRISLNILKREVFFAKSQRFKNRNKINEKPWLFFICKKIEKLV